MIRALLPRRIAAVLSPRAVHVLEYRSTGGMLHPERAVELPGPFETAAHAAARLAEWAGAQSGATARLNVALSGFDTHTHLLTLPAAPDEVLRPVVERESARFAPQLYLGGRRPRVAYVRVGTEEVGGARRQHLLVGVAPAGVVEGVEQQMAGQRVTLEHITLVAAGVRRLHGAYETQPDPSAVLLLLDGPFVGFFHQGELRLFFEPPTMEGRSDVPSEAQVVQLLERGSLFLRQEFRGATLTRVLVAAEPGTRSELAERIAAALSVEVELLDAGADGSPGTLAALGAALDAAHPDGLNLLAPGQRPERSNLLEHALAFATMAVLLLAAVWWATSAVRTEGAARARVARLEQELTLHSADYRAMLPTVEARREHAQRGRVLDALNAELMHLPELLHVLYPLGISVDSLRFTRTPEQWEGTLVATSRGPTSAYAAARVNEYFRSIGAQLPGSTVNLTRLAAQAPDARRDESADAPPDMAFTFQVTFSIPLEADE